MKVSPLKYTDYRKFLRDYFNGSASTYRLVCKATGIKSAGHLSLILNGKVNISDLQADKFAGFCNLKKQETDYFRTLVRFNQEEKSERKIKLFEQLSSFRNSSIYRVGPHGYKFYDKWYHSVVRALLEFVPIKEDTGALGKMVVPHIRPDQARCSVRLLTQLGLVAADENGFLRPTQKSIDTGATAGAVMVNNFALAMLDRAHEAMTVSHGTSGYFPASRLGSIRKDTISSLSSCASSGGKRRRSRETTLRTGSYSSTSRCFRYPDG